MAAKIYVISGGPCTGKTTTLNELEKRKYLVLPEAARKVAETNQQFIGKSVGEIEKKQFQQAIFNYQKEKIEEIKDLKKEEVIFSDRGLGDTLAYYEINRLKTPKAIIDFAKKFRYAKIFILDTLNIYKKDSLRTESSDEAEKIHNAIIKSYKLLGYNIVKVSSSSVQDRADFIEKNL